MSLEIPLHGLEIPQVQQERYLTVKRISFLSSNKMCLVGAQALGSSSFPWEISLISGQRWALAESLKMSLKGLQKNINKINASAMYIHLNHACSMIAILLF